jgi:hypothetical protein
MCLEIIDTFRGEDLLLLPIQVPTGSDTYDLEVCFNNKNLSEAVSSVNTAAPIGSPRTAFFEACDKQRIKIAKPSK